MLVIISLPNWSKFNPRSDRSNYSWFRFENKFFQDQKIFGLTDTQKCLYLFILCLASQENKSDFELDSEFASMFLRSNKDDIIKNLMIIESRGLMTARCRRDDGVMTALRPATNATNVRDERTILSNQKKDAASPSARCILDFESIYSKYPRKEGKNKGMRICKAQIKTEEEFGLLGEAVSRYTDHCKKTITDPKFIKLFSTFMASWRDWLDPETGSNTLNVSTEYDLSRWT